MTIWHFWAFEQWRHQILKDRRNNICPFVCEGFNSTILPTDIFITSLDIWLAQIQNVWMQLKAFILARTFSSAIFYDSFAQTFHETVTVLKLMPYHFDTNIDINGSSIQAHLQVCRAEFRMSLCLFPHFPHCKRKFAFLCLWRLC